MNGIDKASLGARYLIDYLDTKNVVNFDVIKNCTKELRFWALLMHFCNNMNELFDCIPQNIIESLFCKEKIEKVVDILDSNGVKEFEYGKGYASNIKGEYKTQLRLIRNALAHGTFDFDGKRIKVYNPKTSFKASFDYEWFETLILVALSNKNYLIKKGLVDYVIFKFIKEEDYQAKDIPQLEEKGLIKLIRITCSAENSHNVITKFPKLQNMQDRITFDSLKISFLRSLSNLAREIGFMESLEKLKKAYKGIFNIEVLKIDSLSFSDEIFLELSLKDGIEYLVNEFCSQDKTTRSTINLKRILELIDSIDNDVPITTSLNYSLNDTKDFLLNLYGYIYFSQNNYSQKKYSAIFDSFQDKITFKIIHTKKVWEEYIKKISKAIDTLRLAHASFIRIKMWEERLNIYRLRLNHILNDININMLNILRNSLTHGLVEHNMGTITFYGQEPVIKLPKINPKTEELSEIEFQNKDRTFELNMTQSDYLALLDSLYEASGIEIKVNIAKYRKRKEYLKN